MNPDFADLPGRETFSVLNEARTNKPVCSSLHLMPSCECIVSAPSMITEAEIIQQVQAEDEDPDHWRITKVLTKSDVDRSSRLLIGRNQVLAHITPFLTNDPSEFCQNNEELRVGVFDVDTRTEHTLTLKKWKTNSFVLLNKWKKDFVSRRKLKENDEVGLRWDVNASRFEFTVLRRH